MPRILAVVENPSQFNGKPMNKFELYLDGREGKLSNWDLYIATGKDREIFFQGQTTNDIQSMDINTFNLNSRVDRTGKIQFFFINIKTENELFLLIPSEVSNKAIEELNKYIIMDEVELSKDTRDIFYSFEVDGSQSYSGFLFGLPAKLSFKEFGSSLKKLSTEEEQKLKIETGWPTWGVDIHAGDLINNTRLVDLAVSFQKGCFLGQETVAKVHNGRGASFYPSLLVSEDVSKLNNSPLEIKNRKGGEIISKIGNVAMIKLFREFRIENKEFEIVQDNENFKFYFQNYSENLTIKEFSHELYLFAVSSFQSGNEDLAISALRRVIALTPDFSDAYESLGVIYGRQEKFEQGIELMDQLLSVNESSVMAHTNKSLYLMRLGKIEEAEEEKGLATVKSFAEYGKIAKENKLKEQQDKEREEQIAQRESMFRQVLEIDEDDTIANFGIADVYFHRKEFESAKKHLLKVISVDAKYSTAYSLLGKTLEVLGEKEQAKETYTKGIEVASAKGELMPANEMQARLIKL